jgi:hypothetical protein
MKFEKLLWSVFSLLAAGMMGSALFGCHTALRSETAAHPAVEALTSMNRSGSASPGPEIGAVPRTGQTRILMKGDDGDLKAGKPWPVPRFAENGNGTVTDRLTGLIWTRNANQAKGPADWERAVSGAGACRQGGFSDWRLPNRFELESLLDLGKFNPALPAGHPFIDVQPSYYWTSSTTANTEDDAWAIHFYIGFVTKDDKAGSHSVWYVRGDR